MSLTQLKQRAPVAVVPSIGAPQLQQRILGTDVKLVIRLERRFSPTEPTKKERRKKGNIKAAELTSRLSAVSPAQEGRERHQDPSTS